MASSPDNQNFVGEKEEKSVQNLRTFTVDSDFQQDWCCHTIYYIQCDKCFGSQLLCGIGLLLGI